MLGVRRQSVNAVAIAFQAAGLIRYSHGDLSIVNRSGLERAACECYGALEQLSEFLGRPSGSGQSGLSPT